MRCYSVAEAGLEAGFEVCSGDELCWCVLVGSV